MIFLRPSRQFPSYYLLSTRGPLPITTPFSTLPSIIMEPYNNSPFWDIGVDDLASYWNGGQDKTYDHQDNGNDSDKEFWLNIKTMTQTTSLKAASTRITRMATVEAAVVTKGATVSVVIRTIWKVANAVGERVVIASVAMGMMTTMTTRIGSFGGAGRVAASCIK
ncbi:uncharacterized protein QC763_510775 [Podospora pseudopauciseta]|uniref:Uncharacterized protein n=1 Tax=Podospora pseudopauciseta TaxID=2093780 RepID=A0ABR0HBB2_9PEZI|nr:hypothetical protein QC763_510775 [Podospora pseudopauciseta]